MFIYAFPKNAKGEKMELILYTLIFIIGTVFGSFCTLAIYCIPQKKNIINE